MQYLKTKPVAGNSSKISVERQQSAKYERLGHYFIDGWSFAGIEMQHVEDKLSQTVAVMVGYWRYTATHDLQDECR